MEKKITSDESKMYMQADDLSQFTESEWREASRWLYEGHESKLTRTVSVLTRFCGTDLEIYMQTKGYPKAHTFVTINEKIRYYRYDIPIGDMAMYSDGILHIGGFDFDIEDSCKINEEVKE